MEQKNSSSERIPRHLMAGKFNLKTMENHGQLVFLLFSKIDSENHRSGSLRPRVSPESLPVTLDFKIECQNLRVIAPCADDYVGLKADSWSSKLWIA